MFLIQIFGFSFASFHFEEVINLKNILIFSLAKVIILKLKVI
jgi:hypothetical protein